MISLKNFTNFDALDFLTIVEIVMKYKLSQFVRGNILVERRIYMTKNQIDVVNTLETRRHYKATEAEALRHNLEQERIARDQYEESVRANKASEAIRWDANAASRYAANKSESSSLGSARIAAEGSYNVAALKSASDQQIAKWKNTSDQLIAEWNNTIKSRELDIKDFLAKSQGKLNNANALRAQNEANKIAGELKYQDKQLRRQLRLLETQVDLNTALRGKAKAEADLATYRKTLDSLSLLEKTFNDVASRGLDWYKTSSNNRNQMFRNITDLYNTYLRNRYAMEGVLSGWEE